MTRTTLDLCYHLKEHGAVMDCRNSTLSIGKGTRCNVLMFMGQRQATVTTPIDMEIPGRTIQLILGELNGESSSSSEVLVEPLSGSPPRNLCRTDTESSFRRTKLSEATPRHNVLLVDDHVAATQKDGLQATDFNLDSTDLTPPEKTQLQDLVIQFAGLFAPKGGPVSRTQTVKHSIPMEVCPMRQPL